MANKQNYFFTGRIQCPKCGNGLPVENLFIDKFNEHYKEELKQFYTAPEAVLTAVCPICEWEFKIKIGIKTSNTQIIKNLELEARGIYARQEAKNGNFKL